MEDKFLDRLYRLRLLKRFSIRAVNTQTSPAEHSWYVAVLALYIAKRYNASDLSEKDQLYDISSLLTKAMLHDAPEVITSDIVHFIKHFNPATERVMVEIENEAIDNSLLGDMDSSIKPFFEYNIKNAKDDTLEGKLVSLCDLLEIGYYTVNERTVGNIQKWVDEVFKGICDLVESQVEAYHPVLQEIIGELISHLKHQFGSINLPSNSDLIGMSYDKKAAKKS